MRRTVTASAAAVAAGLLAGVLQVLVIPAASPGVATLRQTSGTCTRDIEGVAWFFDPCVAEGEPLPPDVFTALEEDRLARECGVPVSPTATTAARAALASAAQTAFPTAPQTGFPTATQTGFPTTLPTVTSEPTQTPPMSPTHTPTASPCPSPTTPQPTPSTPEPTPSTPEPTPSTPEPTPTIPEPTPTVPEPTPTQTSPEPDPSICALPSSTSDAGVRTDLPARLSEADKDKLCPPNRNPQTPVVVVATGDSLTSAHIQIKHHHEPRKCSVNGNTRADHRKLPGNDMTASYVGKYVSNNASVVDYYNFARTGMGTPEILAAPATYLDACENAWARAFPPISLAEAAIAKAKQDGKQAYYVTTGGINNTNWSQVAAGAAMCGMAEFLRVQVVRYFIRNNLPFNAVMRYYDTRGVVTNRDAIIKGGSCQVILQENVVGDRPREVTIERLRFVIPVYDGPTHYAAITRDVGIITARALAAGADKQVWMGYYDITPAKVAMGNFASTWVQNTDLPDTIKGALPNIPNVETDLVTGLAWKTQVQTWTTELNNAIKASILPNDPKIKFQKPPALGADKIQKTMIGGCPHPNLPGHDDLAASLDAAFRALP